MVLDKYPEIFQYTNYRKYLLDFYELAKKNNSAFSYRYFSKKAGLKSPNYLKLITEGARNLSHESLEAFILVLGLRGNRAEYFRHLVWFNQSSSLQERNRSYEKLLTLKPAGTAKKIESGIHDFYSSPVNIIVRELLNLKGIRNDLKWMGDQVGISEKEMKNILNLLLQLGLAKRTGNGYITSERDLSTGDEVNSLHIKNYHNQMVDLAKKALEQLPGKERDVSSLTLSVKKKDFQKIKEQIQLFRKEVLHLQAPVREGEQILQLNIQLFPLVTLKS